MAMRAQYLTPSASIHCYTVEWEDDVMSWKTFLSDVIGSTNPDEANEISLRGQLSRLWMELEMKGPLDIQNNGIHASSSAFEALVERSIWYKQSLKSDPYFGTRLIAEGISSKTLREWSMNCVINDTKLFDHMKYLGADDCIEKAKSLLKIPSSSLRISSPKNMNLALSTPHLPVIQNKAIAAKSGSKSLNRRLFERALAQDYKEFANNESYGFTQYGNPETRLTTHSLTSQQSQQHENYHQFRVTERKMSYQKTTYSDTVKNLWNANARDRYISDTVSLHDSECEANDMDQPATSFQQPQPLQSQRRHKNSFSKKLEGRGVDGPTLHHIPSGEDAVPDPHIHLI